MHFPSVGVAIPSIPSRAHLLQRAVASVDAQTLPATEISVALDIARDGAAPTRNIAASSLTTDYIAFLDDDDEFLPHHLEVLIQAAIETGADLVYPGFYINRGHGNLTVTPLAAPDPSGRLTDPFGQPFTDRSRDYLVNTANFIPVTFIVRRSLFEATGGFPTPGQDWWQHTECEDWGFLIAVAHTGAQFYHVPERTWVWHHHGRNTSGRPDRF